MTTRFDDEEDEWGRADDPLVSLLRPPDISHLPVPPGQYSTVRRRAVRRRLRRTAGGAALATAAALLIALPLYRGAASPDPTPPQRPLAPAPSHTPLSTPPPSHSSPSAHPTPDQEPSPTPSVAIEPSWSKR
ncbi:hypothetical protein [Streptomyces tsukubensis]|uniref:Uncharacterized protein n=1 Tax=Streptomyces tsukubensis TaxID=83656 RepID=A0A1V4A5W4_9ACTN|nr:hypothetical protein [Streptomyces tsukubensis]OON76192.1 hypothetical protein B1H18_21460 [Streptomyces tsukubensis]QFR93715.1 hypothetical protein GBW32_12275 [Streptomyces tsukubensis]